MWVADADLPRSAGHPFYERLSRLLDEAGFGAFVEEQCAKFYADGAGRPTLPPGRYFRMLLLGYFEGVRAYAEYLGMVGHQSLPESLVVLEHMLKQGDATRIASASGVAFNLETLLRPVVWGCPGSC